MATEAAGRITDSRGVLTGSLPSFFTKLFHKLVNSPRERASLKRHFEEGITRGALRGTAENCARRINAKRGVAGPPGVWRFCLYFVGFCVAADLGKTLWFERGHPGSGRDP